MKQNYIALAALMILFLWIGFLSWQIQGEITQETNTLTIYHYENGSPTVVYDSRLGYRFISEDINNDSQTAPILRAISSDTLAGKDSGVLKVEEK